jgi:hypothetical protein
MAIGGYLPRIFYCRLAIIMAIGGYLPRIFYRRLAIGS